MALHAFSDVSGFLQPALLLALWNALPSLAACLRGGAQPFREGMGLQWIVGEATGGEVLGLMAVSRVSTPLASACDLRPQIPVSLAQSHRPMMLIKMQNL